MADIDKAVNLLALARQHRLSLTAIGEKLQIKRESREDNMNLDIVVPLLATNKADIIEILQDPNAIKQWLGDTQKSLSVKYDALTDGMDRWGWVEEKYYKLETFWQDFIWFQDIDWDELRNAMEEEEEEE